VRRRIEVLLRAYRERLAPFMPGKTQEKRVENCGLLFSSMAGVLMMTRVMTDPRRREETLAEARKMFLKCFAEE